MKLDPYYKFQNFTTFFLSDSNREKIAALYNTPINLFYSVFTENFPYITHKLHFYGLQSKFPYEIRVHVLLA